MSGDWGSTRAGEKGGRRAPKLFGCGSARHYGSLPGTMIVFLIAESPHGAAEMARSYLSFPAPAWKYGQKLGLGVSFVCSSVCVA